MPRFQLLTLFDLRQLTVLLLMLPLAACDISSSDLDTMAANIRSDRVNPDVQAEYARLGQIAESNYDYNREHHDIDWTGYGSENNGGWRGELTDLTFRYRRIREVGVEGYRHRQQLLFENEIRPHFASGGPNFIARYCNQPSRNNQRLCDGFGYPRFGALQNEKSEVQDLLKTLVQYKSCMARGVVRSGRRDVITGLEPVECRESYYAPVSWGRAFDIVDNSEYKEQLCRLLQIEGLPICRWRL